MGGLALAIIVGLFKGRLRKSVSYRRNSMKHYKPSSMMSILFGSVLLLTLTSCTSVKVVEPETKINVPAKMPLGPSFQERMRVFLSGKLPEPIDSEQPTNSATPSLNQ